MQNAYPCIQEKFQSLQFKKDKGGLHYPSNDVIAICEMAEKIYANNKFLGMENPLHQLTQVFKRMY